MAKNSGWTTAAAALATAVVGGLIVEWTKAFPLLDHLSAATGSFYGWLESPVRVPRALVLATLMFVGGVIVLGARAWLAGTREPSWSEDYKADSFFGVDWRWDYYGNSIARNSLRAYCPQCQCQLTPQSEGYVHFTTVLLCDRCGFSVSLDGNGPDVLSRVMLRIERAVNTGEWKSQLKQNPS